MAENIAAKKTEPQVEKTPDVSDEYVFRFKIEPWERQKPSDPDSVLADFYKGQIKDLMKMVFFSRNGEKIIPTEYGFLNDQEKLYPIWKDE